jgi:hypothetical protein
MSSPTDAEVIGRSAGEPEAFGLIYDRHAATLLRFLGRRVGPQVAEALIGELFRVAFERRKTFDASRATALPWLYGIGANLLLKHRRAEARRLRANAREAASLEASDRRAGATKRGKKWSGDLKKVVSTTLMPDATTRLVFLNLVAAGAAGLVMVWTRQKYWQAVGVPLAYFGVLDACYSLLVGFAARSAAHASARYGQPPLLAAVGILPLIAYFGMASFFGWAGILFGLLIQISRGLGDVLFLNALNERITSAFRATVISMAQLGTRASFVLLGPLVGYGIDTWGLPSVLYALGFFFAIAFAFLLLPLVVRDMPPAQPPRPEGDRRPGTATTHA